MAEAGTIEQYQGPFDSGYTITLDGQCIIGISVSEDDFMLTGSETGDSSIQFSINNNSQTIFIGRTFIYQTQQQYQINTITFPSGAPESTLVNVVYCSERE